MTRTRTLAKRPTPTSSTVDRIVMAAKLHGRAAAQTIADGQGCGIYQSAQWPQCGELWQSNEEGEWTRKLADLTFKEEKSDA